MAWCAAARRQTLAADRLQEPEADDRLGIAEAVGDVAANLAAAAGKELPGELPANPLLQRCFEALGDPRPEVQDCAAASLGQVFCNLYG